MSTAQEVHRNENIEVEDDFSGTTGEARRVVHDCRVSSVSHKGESLSVCRKWLIVDKHEQLLN